MERPVDAERRVGLVVVVGIGHGTAPALLAPPENPYCEDAMIQGHNNSMNAFFTVFDFFFHKVISLGCRKSWAKHQRQKGCRLEGLSKHINRP